MSRSRQFLHGLGSSWFATASAVVYSLLSVPIALRYLSVDEFGLFVLLLQISAYFTLIEIGMSAATARILIDHKDDRDGRTYGSIILTSFLFFAIQGFITAVLGFLAAPWIINVVHVPSALAEDATLLLRWLALTSGLTLAFRAYGSVLYANKRLDLIHVFMGASMLFGLALLGAILAAGGGLESLRWQFLAQAIISILFPALACHRLELLPKTGCWGCFSIKRFLELFGFGKDIFLVNVGNQVLDASQLIIVTRTMGLTAAATWSVSAKLFLLVYQLVTKIEGTAIVFFAEMIVRGEKEKLALRFRQIYQLTAAVGVFALAIVVAINGSFVSAWANPSLAWTLSINALFAFSILLNTLTRCSVDLIIHTKNIASFRYVYFLEAVIFVLLSLWLSAHFGFYGILGSSILCTLVFRATYTTWRMAQYFQVPAVNFWWTWLKRPFLGAIILLPFVLSSPWPAVGFTNLWAQLFVTGAWICLPAIVTLLFVTLPRDVKKELALRWQQHSFLGKH